MDKFDEYLNNKVEMESEKFILPKSFEDKIEETLESLDKKNLEKEEKWYFNKNIWIIAACFAFISLTVLVTNKNNNETTNDLIRMSSEMDNNSSIVSYNNAESGSIREYSSNESVEEQLESNININDSFIDYNNINKIIIKGKFKGYVIDFIEKKEAIKTYNKINKDYKITLDNIIGNSDLIVQTKRNALIASRSTSTILITGESGTGKELFARSIHNHSDRVDNPFVTVNCAAIPDNLLESELFGYEEGSFTGAKKGGKLGKFELADKGTIFLDEIGDMSLHLQAKLLRVLQERELDKIGGKSNIFIDVRIIAATNKNLETMVKNGSFREDLYYRLNVIPIKLPSLRERRGDIPLLINYMIDEYSHKLEKEILGIDENAKQLLINYSWPGNIRELQNVIEYSINMSQSKVLTLDSMPKSIMNIDYDKKEEGTEEIRTLEELEIREIKKALIKYKDYKKDKELAAKSLGISRATLYRKLEKYKDKINGDTYLK